MGLMMRPTSWAVVSLSSRTCPVSGSTDTSATCAQYPVTRSPPRAAVTVERPTAERFVRARNVFQGRDSPVSLRTSSSPRTVSSSSGHPSSSAAKRHTSCCASRTAPSAAAEPRLVARLPPTPESESTSPVSATRTWMRSAGRPIDCAATCWSTVYAPAPCSNRGVVSTTAPSGSSVTTAPDRPVPGERSPTATPRPTRAGFGSR